MHSSKKHFFYLSFIFSIHRYACMYVFILFKAAVHIHLISICAYNQSVDLPVLILACNNFKNKIIILFSKTKTIFVYLNTTKNIVSADTFNNCLESVIFK